MIDGHVTDVESIHSTTQPLVCNYKMKYSDGIKPQGLNKIFLSRGHKNKTPDANNKSDKNLFQVVTKFHIFQHLHMWNEIWDYTNLVICCLYSIKPTLNPQRG